MIIIYVPYFFIPLGERQITYAYVQKCRMAYLKGRCVDRDMDEVHINIHMCMLYVYMYVCMYVCVCVCVSVCVVCISSNCLYACHLGCELKRVGKLVRPPIA